MTPSPVSLAAAVRAVASAAAGSSGGSGSGPGAEVAAVLTRYGVQESDHAPLLHDLAIELLHLQKKLEESRG